MTRLRAAFLGGALLCAIGAGAVGAVATMPELQWRARVIGYKLRGQLRDLSFQEILRWMRPGSPVYLGGLAKDPSPFVAITNLYTDESSRSAGRALYDGACARCHGENGEGGAGPTLVDPRRSASDWALFRVIQRGVPETAMQAQPLDEREIWQVVAFIRSRAGSYQSGDSGPTLVDLGFVDADRIDEAESDGEWTTYAGSYAGWRFSGLDQIHPGNVRQLALAWLHQIDSDETMTETTPIVVDGIMFATEPPNAVVALNAASGERLWSYRRSLPDELVLCCGAVNRGVAILGDAVFLGTLDAHLVALDAASGRVKWDREVARGRAGYSITAAPLAIPGAVITGVGGGEFGIRGFLAAYDPESGREKWRFETIPEPDEPFGDTWGGGRETGGVPTWGTGSYDPELGLVYWGAGHPAPDFNGDGRPGDNLFSNSLLALDAETGELVWHFQFTPHDEWDWDTTQVPVLVDREIEGQLRKLVLLANRNGFYYVLDRESGEFIAGTPFAKQTWADGLTPDGRALVREEARPSREGALVYPGVTGATNWWPPSYSPLTDLFYVPTLEKPTLFFKREEEYTEGEMYLGGVGRPVPGYKHYTAVRALEPTTGERRWELRFPERGGWSYVSGPLTTAGNLLFVGDDETFYAVDARTGERLWQVHTGGGINAPPMTYEVAGRQYVTIAAGRALLTFSLPPDAPRMARDGSAARP